MGEHEVWFEDARSIEAKLGLIRDYGLRGCAWWNVMRPFTLENLSTMNALYNIEHGTMNSHADVHRYFCRIINFL